MTKEELKNKILEYNVAYREGRPIISDEEFDNCLDEFKETYPKEYPELREKLFESAGDITHKYPVGSFEKIKNDASSDDNIQKWIANDPEDTSYSITEKIDGTSMTVRYEGGVLVEALSRGDGITGVDKTNKMSLIVPKVIEYKKPVTIRGEVTFTYDVFDQVKEVSGYDFKNLRNATTGVINAKDPLHEVVRALCFIAYRVWDCEEDLKNLFNGSQSREIAFIASQGFLTPPITVVDRKNLTASHLEEIWNHILISNPRYQVDGLVIQKNTMEALNERALIPEHGKAYKFNSLVAETTLRNIIWQVSKSGYMCPVAVFDPIDLGGSTITRCTLHNLKTVIDNRLVKDLKIRICKSGDVIPFFLGPSIPADLRPWDTFEKVKEDFIPIKCPSCGSDKILVRRDAVEIRCMNGIECPAQAMGKLEFFLRNLGVEGASIISLDKWGIRNFEDLVSFMDRNDPKGKNQTKFYAEVKDKVFDEKITLEELVANLDWDGISTKIWAKIFEKIPAMTLLKLLKKFIIDEKGGETDTKKQIFDTLASIPGIKDQTIINIATGFLDNMVVIKMLCDNCQTFKLKDAEEIANEDPSIKILKDQVFVITGALSKPRKEWVDIIEKLGGRVGDKVNAKTDFLVTNDKTTETSKLKDAKRLMIPIIDEKELAEKCNGQEI